MDLAAFKLRLMAVSLLLVVSVVYSRFEEATIEAKWKRIHPKPRHHREPWYEAENLTYEQHKRICDDVLLQTIDPTEFLSDYKYMNVSKIKGEGVLNVPVEFLHGIGDTLKMTLVLCRYEGLEFYLAQGKKDTVFRLVRHPDKGIIFKSGEHRVMYNISSIPEECLNKLN